MAQETKIIDLRRSYVPIPPESMPITLHGTANEDTPETRIPVIPYAGYNFMPTPQGYCSFFGINSKLDFSTLFSGVEGVDDFFMIQTNTFQNIIVALCDTGIFTAKNRSGSISWVQEITLAEPAEHREWSRCVIDNIIYVYRQAETSLWVASPGNNYVFTEVVPTGINMAGQLGIFKAGGRLGFWDSENSTGWGGLRVPTAFGDADELSGFTIFQDIVGRIVLCLQHGDGFLIYATKSIVYVRRDPASPLLFSGRSTFNNNGISYRQEACYSDPDSTHFVFTTQGVAQITNGVAELIIPEIATFLKEKRQPIYLQMLNGRYLYFKFLDPYYAQNRVGFRNQNVPGTAYTFARAVQKIDEWAAAVAAINLNGSTIPGYAGYVSIASRPENILLTIEKNATSTYLNRTYGYTAFSQSGPSETPVWKNNLSRSITSAHIVAWKNYDPQRPFGSPKYFENLINTDQGYDASVTATPLIIVPTGLAECSNTAGLQIEYISASNAHFTDAITRLNAIEEAGYNDSDFYMKQETIFSSEESFFNDWLNVALRKFDFSNTGTRVGIALSEVPEGTTFEDGVTPWILDRSVHSYTTTRYYGANQKAAWLQQSLCRIFRIKYTIQRIGVIDGSDSQVIQLVVNKRAEYRYIDNCLFKMLGFTKIAAHGHFNPAGDLVIDDTDAEDPAHRDVCESGDERLRKKNQYHFGVYDIDNIIAGTDPETQPYSIAYPITPPWETGALYGYTIPDLTIDGEEYPPEFFNITAPSDIVFPDSTVFLQDGSPAPLYPLFLGAFIFDVQYKKWGKTTIDFFHLLDLYPINNVAGEGYIPYNTFLPRVACLRDDGLVYIFDKYPEESEFVLGKYGEYRKGLTTLHEIEVQFRESATGSFSYEGSIDNKNVNSLFSKTFIYTNQDEFIAYTAIDAKWFNFVIRGYYDLTYLAIASSRASRR